MSIVTSLALIKTLQHFDIPKLSIKWPNDILSEKKKICGILIENTLKQQQIQSSIIGVGLNVNQTHFIDLPKASSLKLITGKTYNLTELLDSFLDNLKFYFDILDANQHKKLFDTYTKYLFRKGKPSTFKDCKNDNLFPAYIKGVNESGKLILELEDAIEKSYGLKEIQLLY